MNLQTFISEFIVTLAVVYVFVESAIYAPIRIWVARRGGWFRVFAYCPYCVGFWAMFFVHIGPSWAALNLNVLAESVASAVYWLGVFVLIRGIWPGLFDGASTVHALESPYIDGVPPPTTAPVAEDESE